MPTTGALVDVKAGRYVCHLYMYIPAKSLHNYDIVSVHFNNFYRMEICDKRRRDLVMITYIYLNVNEC